MSTKGFEGLLRGLRSTNEVGRLLRGLGVY